MSCKVVRLESCSNLMDSQCLKLLKHHSIWGNALSRCVATRQPRVTTALSLPRLLSSPLDHHVPELPSRAAANQSTRHCCYIKLYQTSHQVTLTSHFHGQPAIDPMVKVMHFAHAKPWLAQPQLPVAKPGAAMAPVCPWTPGTPPLCHSVPALAESLAELNLCR